MRGNQGRHRCSLFGKFLAEVTDADRSPVPEAPTWCFLAPPKTRLKAEGSGLCPQTHSTAVVSSTFPGQPCPQTAL